ncbi:MBL fold metallo-hydrolase [Candidatus Micrarchaeota archaeon]|nr:MBL fold metallo-hydrolase [Candidatus Micrarchaeota archaeon]
MQLSFLGACREVGRSCFLLEGKHTLLLDAGVKFSRNEEYPLLDRKQIRRIEKVILSHAHLDHSGYIPALYASGYKGKVACTKPTRDFTQILLADYLRLNPELAPFKETDVNQFLTNTELLEYGERDSLNMIQFRDAGHILGSAMVEVYDTQRLLYTGDFSCRSTRLLPSADLNGVDADVLIMEGTYGGVNDQRASSKELAQRLVSSVQKTLDKGGKVLIPTFAIGRGQEVLFILENFMRSGHLESVPIFMDGMVRKALRIHRHNALYLKDEIKRRILTSEDDPFKSKHYVTPTSKDRHEVFEKEKAIIVAPSGMLSGGPSLLYLKALANDRKNKVLLTGYQAEGTLGRQLSDGVRDVEIDGERVHLKLEVEEARLSAHADRDELIHLVRNMPSLKNVFVVHGEERTCLELKDALDLLAKKQERPFKVHVPSRGESFSL